MFLPPPEFLFDTCLKLNLGRCSRLKLAEIADRGEPCVRKWYRDYSFPSEFIDKLLEYFSKSGNGTFVDEVNKLLEEPTLSYLDAFKWRLFCARSLTNADVFLPYTLQEIYSDSVVLIDAVSSGRKLKPDQRFDHFKRFILTVVGPKLNLPHNLKQQVEASNDFEGLRPAMIWLAVETFIYFLAMAEVEYLWIYYGKNESKLVRWILPKLRNEKVRYPVIQFFGCFFDDLVTRGYYRSLGEIAEKLPRILPLSKKGKESRKNRSDVDEDSRMRHIKRVKYEGKAPSFETFNAWVDELIPSHIYDSPKDREQEKQLLQDLMGVARIVDGFFRDASKEIAEKDLVCRFESYESWHFVHSKTLTVG